MALWPLIIVNMEGEFIQHVKPGEISFPPSCFIEPHHEFDPSIPKLNSSCLHHQEIVINLLIAEDRFQNLQMAYNNVQRERPSIDVSEQKAK
jgi:hypothetical protein